MIRWIYNLTTVPREAFNQHHHNHTYAALTQADTDSPTSLEANDVLLRAQLLPRVDPPPYSSFTFVHRLLELWWAEEWKPIYTHINAASVCVSSVSVTSMTLQWRLFTCVHTRPYCQNSVILKMAKFSDVALAMTAIIQCLRLLSVACKQNKIIPN